MRSVVLTSAVAGVLTLAGTASAGVILTYSYNDLDGSYIANDATSGNFQAVAADLPNFRSSGEVSRLSSPEGNAQFRPGFVIQDANADFQLFLAVSNNDGTRADGLGRFVATDVDGDTLSADIVGEWRNGGSGITFFNGLLSNVVFSDPSGTFDGSNGTSISTDFSPFEQPFSGAIVQLFINTSSGGFFNQSFNDIATDVDGHVVIPAPGALALLGLGGLAVLRRRPR